MKDRAIKKYISNVEKMQFIDEQIEAATKMYNKTDNWILKSYIERLKKELKQNQKDFNDLKRSYEFYGR